MQRKFKRTGNKRKSGYGRSGSHYHKSNRSFKSRYGRYREDDLGYKYRRNNLIKANTIQVIDSDGSNLGTIDTTRGLQIAREKGLDLIEVLPNTDPPVCRIASWSKFIYEYGKKQKEARKNKQKEMKELRFGALIAESDKRRLLNRAREFLNKGHNVKITVTRKGRVTADLSKNLMERLLTALSEYSTIDASPSYQGRMISMIFKGGPPKVETKESSVVKKDGEETKDKKNSGKKVSKDSSKGDEGVQDTVQQEQAGSSEN